MDLNHSHSADSLPGEVARPMLRRLNAEQDRHINLARIADSLERLNETLTTGRRQEQFTPKPTACRARSRDTGCGAGMSPDEAIEALFGHKLLTRAEVERIVRDVADEAEQSGWDAGYADGAAENDS